MDDVTFIFEGKKYEVDYESGETNQILLPDGRLIVATRGWNEEVYPPQPVGLCEEMYSLPDLGNLDNVQIANRLNAVLAIEVKE